MGRMGRFMISSFLLFTDVSKNPFRYLSTLFSTSLIRKTEVNTLQDTGINHIGGHVGEAAIISCLLVRFRVSARDRE
jgi:hypothetical protein